ncbi:MAG TPA: sulfite exporter TauE/SafE family protein [Pseudonocardia sp.]|jgi:uncharacterized membrane protein YfcA|nr:sulfite exporter TauE/SafE family protein [Pseudonocardia sp.]
MTVGTVLLLVVAGLAAGLAGSIAGLASLFSYPALLAAGLPATAANVTNTVALAFSTVGAVAGSRPELVGQSGRARSLGVLALVGGASGAGLLLVTPHGVFERVVPFLVGGASLVLLLGGRARAAAPGDPRPVEPPELGSRCADTDVEALSPPAPPRRPLMVGAGVLAVSVYGGYFGAAAGVLMLALLITMLPETLVRANGLKNLLLGLANIIAAVGFAVFGPVSWHAAVPLAAGLLVGAWSGPAVARRVPSEPLRLAIGLAGLGLALKLGLDAY